MKRNGTRLPWSGTRTAGEQAHQRVRIGAGLAQLLGRDRAAGVQELQVVGRSG